MYGIKNMMIINAAVKFRMFFLSSYLLEKKSGIVIAPGTAVGKDGEGYFRISYVCSDEKLQEVIDRMKADGFRY